MLLMDQALARRLERAEGFSCTSFVPVRQRLAPGVAAAWQDFAGTFAIFDGVDSPLTQTFGLGMFAPVTGDQLAAIEAFFFERGADAMHEVSPLAGIEAFARLTERGYRPLELSTVLVQPIAGAPAGFADGELRVRQPEPADLERWVATSVAGWSRSPEDAAMMEAIARAASQNPAAIQFLVERGDQPIATGALVIHEGIALLAGACTIPAARGLGAQGRLLAARLDEARRRGCDLAMMVATPGSTSQRNAERRGFRVAYTRMKWGLAAGRRAGSR